MTFLLAIEILAASVIFYYSVRAALSAPKLVRHWQLQQEYRHQFALEFYELAPRIFKSEHTTKEMGELVVYIGELFENPNYIKRFFMVWLSGRFNGNTIPSSPVSSFAKELKNVPEEDLILFCKAIIIGFVGASYGSFAYGILVRRYVLPLMGISSAAMKEHKNEAEDFRCSAPMLNSLIQKSSIKGSESSHNLVAA